MVDTITKCLNCGSILSVLFPMCENCPFPFMPEGWKPDEDKGKES